jgi:hypothetical protein
MAELERNQRTRPWWAGRVEAREIVDLAAGDPAAAPRWQAAPSVRGILGGRAQRRRLEVLTPERRPPSPDLEATAQGIELYGARRAVPAGDQLLGPSSLTPATTAGTKLSYKPLEGRAAYVDGVHVTRSAAAAALAYQLQLLRGGLIYVLRAVGDADLDVATPITLQPGDELRVEVLTPTAAAVTLTSHFSVRQRT